MWTKFTGDRVDTRDLSKISTIDLLGKIERAQNVDLSKLTLEQCYMRLHMIFRGYITRLKYIGASAIFRLRRFDSNTLCNTTSELWYPRPEHVTERGRFNQRGEPRLYASDALPTAMAELNVAPGDRVGLIVAAPNLDRAGPRCTVIGEHLGPPTIPVNGPPNQRSDEKFIEQLRASKTLYKWLAIDNFISDLTTADCVDPTETLYKMTNCLAGILQGTVGFEGIQYPSVALRLGAFNLCLSTAVADQCFQPAEVWIIDIVNGEGQPRFDTIRGVMQVGLRPIARSKIINGDGSIQWTNDASLLNPDLIARPFVRHPQWRLSLV